ncbi:putative metallo-beta-lactamase domain protein [Xylariaceae sp. AK1471]|nr:putative metallo-beta-lactamase domain protein [Xylariaceae sp. AK1471]
MAPGKGGYRQINKALNICAFDDYLEGQQTHLPKILDVEQISPLVVRVLGQNPGKFTLQGTNTYIVGSGSNRLLIDTGQGIPEWADLISSTLADASISLSHVLLTHWHGDHTGGVPDLIRMYPDLANSIHKHTPSKSQKPIADGQIFSVEGATIQAVHSPGHSLDHMCFILKEENAMFTGDNILGHGTAAVEHLSTLMTTWRNMQDRDCTKGYPAHGIVIDDLRAKINIELAQKQRRERQVLKTLQEMKRIERNSGGRGTGSITLHDLVTTIHGAEVDEGVRKLALEPFMEEVLRKLAEDGDVAFEIRGGVKKWFAIEMIMVE